MAEKIKSYWNERWTPLITEKETKSKDYFISDYGRIKSVDKLTNSETFLKGSTLYRGYKVLNITFKDNSTKGFYVQRVVAEAFIKKDSEDQDFIIHIDHNVQNNHYENLRWSTREELTAYFKEKGVFNPQKRKRNAAYKMTPSKVKILKKMLKEGKTKKRILAKQFNITTEQLRKIDKGIDWAWVTLDEEE